MTICHVSLLESPKVLPDIRKITFVKEKNQHFNIHLALNTHIRAGWEATVWLICNPAGQKWDWSDVIQSWWTNICDLKDCWQDSMCNLKLNHRWGSFETCPETRRHSLNMPVRVIEVGKFNNMYRQPCFCYRDDSNLVQVLCVKKYLSCCRVQARFEHHCWAITLQNIYI